MSEVENVAIVLCRGLIHIIPAFNFNVMILN